MFAARSRISRTLPAVVACTLMLSGCTTEGGSTSPASSAEATTTILPTTTTTTTTSTTTTTAAPRYPIEGKVFGVAGAPLRNATVTIGDDSVVTGDDGVFVFDGAVAASIEVSRPAYLATTVEWDGTEAAVGITLEPRVNRALRVALPVARDDDQFAALLELAERSAVDALVFDTKKEGGNVLYDTAVEEAHAIGAVGSTYDPVERIEQAKAAGLYTITRIVSFEDPIRAAARPEYKLAGDWIDPTNPDTWEYMLDLGTEACELGFDEIQFDYVRFPTGQASVQSARTHPTTGEERVAAIAAYLTEARDRLHPMGCAVGADIFAIVMSAPNDQGIGQRPEDLSGIVDVLSPMIYPSHYSDGWLGFADPNDYPGEVTADALDDGMPRIDGGTLVRPWLQAFSWSNAEILESIGAAERRGVGWMLWNASSNYDLESLPEPGTFAGEPQE